MASQYIKQAPQSMAMIAPDLQEEQMALSRQQQLIDMLRKEGNTPIEQQMVSGHVVKISPWQGLAKMLQAGVGGYLQKKSDDESQDVSSRMNSRIADLLRDPQEAPQNGQLGSGTYGVLPTADGVPAIPAQVSKPNPFNMAALLRGQAIGSIGGDQASAAYWDDAKKTSEMKNMAAMGQDPMLMGRLGTAAARKAGMFEMQPGTTSIDMATGQERFNPKVGEGISLNNGVAAPIQGYAAANAGIQGAQTAAQEQAKAETDMITVNGVNGPVLMPRSQAIAASRGAPAPAQPQPQAPAQPGAPANQGFPAGTQLPAPTPGVQSRREILNQEQAAIQARPDSDPRKAADLAAIGREIKALPADRPQVGIPLQSEAQREVEVGGAKVKNAVDEALAKALPQERRDKQEAIAKGESALTLIDKALSHPGIKVATGLQGTIDPRNYIPGTNAKDFQVVMDQLGGQTFLQAMQSLRGTGQITEIEGKKASDAIARLNRSQSTGEFQAALKDFKAIVSKGIGRVEGQADSIDVARDKLAAPRTPSIPSMADIDAELARRLKGK